MIVAIHQPNYIPWMGFFDKIIKSDIFVFLDNVQYPRGSWCNRVKIKSIKGPAWLSVPVKRKFGQKIFEAEIDNTQDWRTKHLNIIEFAYKKSPFFDEYFPLIKNILKKQWILLEDLNIETIKTICKILDLKQNFFKGKELDVEGSSTELLINIVKAVGGDTYLSMSTDDYVPPYQEDEKFRKSKLKVIYQKFRYPIYQQLFGDFIPGLSIIDALFNVGEEEVKKILEKSKKDWKEKLNL